MKDVGLVMMMMTTRPVIAGNLKKNELKSELHDKVGLNPLIISYLHKQLFRLARKVNN